jgi:Importin beta binding domain
MKASTGPRPLMVLYSRTILFFHNGLVKQIENNARHSSNGGGFKKVLNETDGRRSREETTLQIRKNRKDEILRKRRNVLPISASLHAAINYNSDHDATKKFSTVQTDRETVQAITEIVEVFQRWISMGKQMILSSDSNDENENSMDFDSIMMTNNHRKEVLLPELLDNVRTIRRMLATENNPPVQCMLNSGILFFLVEMIDISNIRKGALNIEEAEISALQSKLIFEATWALTNIASTDYADSIVQYPNAIERLIALLAYEADGSVREQSIWCLGNIAGDNYFYRDILLNDERVKAGFLQNLMCPQSVSLLSTLCWAISNLCRKSSAPKNKGPTSTKHTLLQPTIEATRCFIHPMYQTIQLSIEMYREYVLLPSSSLPNLVIDEMICDAMWCMTYLSDGDNSRTQVLLDEAKSFESDDNYAVNKNGTIVFCVKEILDMYHKAVHQHSKFEIRSCLLMPCIKLLGNLASGTNEQTSAMVNTGVLKYIPDLLRNTSVSELFLRNRFIHSDFAIMLTLLLHVFTTMFRSINGVCVSL